MDAINDPQNEEIIFIKSAQVGATEILNNIIGYFMDQDPSPMLVLQPTLEMAETWSKDRLSPMLRDTPVLSGKIQDNKKKDSGNTILHKIFPGGHLTAAGANSPSSLASRPIRILLTDEIDRYPSSAGEEGDPIDLGKKRTTTFWNRLIFKTSTPTIKGISRVEKDWEISDQRRYFVPCPHCGEFQHLQWKNIQFDSQSLTAVLYLCEHCGAFIEEADKPEMIRKGEWRATSPFNGIAGFHINELYSPWSSWLGIVKEFLKVHKDPMRLRVWVNTTLGETFEEKGETVDSESLLNRREPYQDELPEGVLVLTAGVDVQKDRLELELVGWGDGDESWSIDYRIFYGSPSMPDVWGDLDDYLKQTFTHANGHKVHIAAACVDTGGHHTDAVYKFVKPRQVRRVYGIKGSSTSGMPIIGNPSRKNKGKILLFLVGVDTAKETLYSHLKILEPGPGYCHFSQKANDESYFAQLTAEEMVTRYEKGHPKQVWVLPSGKRNEALDCRVYAMAAKNILNPNYGKLAENSAKKIKKQQTKEKSEANMDSLLEQPKETAKKRMSKSKKKGGFINRW